MRKPEILRWREIIFWCLCLFIVAICFGNGNSSPPKSRTLEQRVTALEFQLSLLETRVDSIQELRGLEGYPGPYYPPTSPENIRREALARKRYLERKRKLDIQTQRREEQVEEDKLRRRAEHEFFMRFRERKLFDRRTR